MSAKDRRGALRVLLVVKSDQQCAELKAALAALPDPQLEILETQPELANGRGDGGPRADVEMIVFSGEEDEAGLTHLRDRATHAPRPALFALLDNRAPTLMRRVLRAGADEVLFLPLDPVETTRALLKLTEARWRSERGGRGVICSLTATVGGVGVSMLSANLALALRHTLNKRVAAVDLDLQEAGLGVFLNLEAERTISDLVDASRKLDSIQLELALSKHPSGIYLLAAPKKIEESELITETTIAAVLELMRQMFDYAIVDCGRHVSEISLAAWERSDHLYYVLDQSLSSVRCALRFLELFRRLKVNVEPQFILNRFSPQHPISDEQVAHTLAQPICARIPRDDRNAERIQWGAHDLWQVAPRSALVKSFEGLAAMVVANGVQAPPPHQSGLIARLLSSIAGG